MASMAFAETETKVTKNPFALRWPQREGFLAEKRHVQQHRRHNTGELPKAHHNGTEHCLEACKNDGISCCQKRHCGVHDGVGHAKPPQLGVGIHHDGRHCQCAGVIRTRWTRTASRSALGRQGRNCGLVRCSKERPGTMAHGDRTSRQRTNILLGGLVALSTSTPLRRAASDPSSIKLKSFHLSSATAAGGGPRSGATSLCMLALDVPNFHNVVEETELLLKSAVADHLLSLRVDLSSWTPSQGDGIQGAEMKTVLCGIGSLQGCYVRILLLLKMAPKFSRDQRVRARTTIGEWHRNNTEWVRHISWVDAQARRAIGRRLHSWAEQRRMHNQTTHEESVHTDPSWDWRCNAPKPPAQSPCEKSEFLELLGKFLFS